MKTISIDRIGEYTSLFVPFQTVLEENIRLEGKSVPYSISGSSIDGYIERIAEGRFTVFPLSYVSQVSLEILIQEGFISNETLDTMEANRLSEARRQSRKEALDRACSQAEHHVDEAKKLAKEVGQPIMKEAIERLEAILEQRRAEYLAEVGKEWFFDTGF